MTIMRIQKKKTFKGQQVSNMPYEVLHSKRHGEIMMFVPYRDGSHAR
jgi:hypothetical protein